MVRPREVPTAELFDMYVRRHMCMHVGTCARLAIQADVLNSMHASRLVRTAEDMAREALHLRGLFSY